MQIGQIDKEKIKDIFKKNKPEDVSAVLFEYLYLRIRNFLDWQYKKKQQKILLPEKVGKQTFAYRSDHSKELMGNLYYPSAHPDTKKLPLIIDIHGGGWIHGDKDLYDSYSARLVQAGHTVGSLTYRTIDQVSLKEQVQDIFAYLHYLQDHADELEINLDQVMLTGDSAGAQLALLCYTINQDPALQKLFGVKPVRIHFSCMILTHPVCFVDQAGQIPRQQWLSEILTVPGLQTMMYGKDYQNSPIYQNSANPSFYIDEKTDFPPILLVTSEGDILFKYQTYLLADFFNKMNIGFELFVEDNKAAQHVYNVNNPEHDLAEKCNDKIIDFFKNARMTEETSKHVQSPGN